MRKSVLTALRAQFRPEFLNRIDDIVIFHPLGLPELISIIEIQMKNLKTRLAEKKLSLVLTDPAKKYLAQEGYDPIYGARPLKRIIQRDILNPLALRLLQGDFKEGDTIEADLSPDRTLTLKRARTDGKRAA
jgi:ATP-dependent Clp protease ATP-binding subunit ClpB